MGGMVRNLMVYNTGVDLYMQKIRDMTADQYRAFIWAVFLRILNETPQFSGKAVANWNISLNTPNFDYDDSLGDNTEIFGGSSFGQRGLTDVRQRGDKKWIDVAKRRNQPILWGPGGGPNKGFSRGGATYKDKVFISNGVRGDDDEGKSVEAYMESLQDPAYAARKLRAANQPYENAQESVIVVAAMNLSRGISVPRVGGEDFR